MNDKKDMIRSVADPNGFIYIYNRLTREVITCRDKDGNIFNGNGEAIGKLDWL